MGLETGLVKYVVFTPLTIVGFVSMYVFGGGIITFLNTMMYLFSGNFIESFMEYFIYSALPPTSITHIIFQVAVGSLIAGLKWYAAMSSRY